MRPEDGSRIWKMVFENTGELLRARIRDETFRVLARGEPRATVVEVLVTEKKKEVDVDVIFEFRGSSYKTSLTMERK